MPARGGRIGPEPGLVDLDDVGAGGLQVPGFGVHGVGEGHDQRLLVAVVLIDALQSQGEGTGQGDPGAATGVAAQEAHVLDLDGAGPSDGADHAWHLNPAPWTQLDGPRPCRIHPLQRQDEAVGIALPADLAVGDDVDAGALHVFDGQAGGVVLGLGQDLRSRSPDVRRIDAGHVVAPQPVLIDQPVRLRIAADHGRRQQLGKRCGL